MSIGQRLRAARKALGITQQELAERLSLTQSQISHIEIGHSPPSYAIAQRLSAFFGFSVEELCQHGSQAERRRERADSRMHFGERVQTLRKQLGVSQAVLADYIGMNATYLSRIETGHRGVPMHKVAAFAEALGVTIDKLVKGEP